ncbi:DMT family transporter [Legionella sp. CNM-4043-24]|uniref:DMT family transporter n=1 Tax=Legionella sp. CNM-4043-24 TaxID=3421646 RepID=UPI00403B244E
MNTWTVKITLAFTILVWASAFVAIRIGLPEFSPGELALYRFLVASVCMLFLYVRLPARPHVPWSVRIQLLLIGVAGIGIYNICLNVGEMTVSAGVASFVIGMMPVITILLSVIFLKERPGILVWLGVTISVIGLFMLMSAESTEGLFSRGVVLIFISALMGSFYTLMQRPYLREYHPIVVTAWVLWGGTLFLSWFLPGLSREITHAGLAANAAAIYMGVFPGALAYIAWSQVLNHMPASEASLYLYGMPVLSTIMGYALLSEQPALFSLVGGFLTLLGAMIATRKVSWSR